MKTEIKARLVHEEKEELGKLVMNKKSHDFCFIVEGAFSS
jgi:hypothetical protein